MVLIACATTSWSSRAIRVRSSATASLAVTSRSVSSTAAREDTLTISARPKHAADEKGIAEEAQEEAEVAGPHGLSRLDCNAPPRLSVQRRRY